MITGLIDIDKRRYDMSDTAVAAVARTTKRDTHDMDVDGAGSLDEGATSAS